jgi:hypothetical protein
MKSRAGIGCRGKPVDGFQYWISFKALDLRNKWNSDRLRLFWIFADEQIDQDPDGIDTTVDDLCGLP